MDDTWKADLATFIDDHVGSLVCNGVKDEDGTDAGTFTWAKSVFEAALSTGTKENLAAAWESAALGSSMAIPALSYIGSLTPTSQWSVVASVVVDPASVAAGKAKILSDLATIQNVSLANQSTFPVTLRAAFLLLTVTITGTDNNTGSNAPLTDAGRGLK
jgi:hypothetical protein